MLYNTAMLVTDRISKLGFRLTLLLVIIQALVLLSSWRFLPPKLPLFYSRPWGEEQLTTAAGLWLISGLSLIVFLVNLASASLAGEESLAKQILAVSGLIFSFLGLISLIQIVRLVI